MFSTKEINSLVKGDVVYYPNDSFTAIRVGLYDGPASDRMNPVSLAYVKYLEVPDRRYVRSKYVKPTPISEFETEKIWHELPKHYHRPSELFGIEDRTPEWMLDRRKHLLFRSPTDIKIALTEGILVPAEKNYHGDVNVEIDAHKGWRIYKRYPYWTLSYGRPNPEYTRTEYRNLFLDFESAKEWTELVNAEKKRIRDMSDTQYSIWDIEKVLKRFSYEKSCQYRAFLSKLPDLADVEVRKCGDTLQWGYRRNEWKTAEVDPREIMARWEFERIGAKK